MKYRDFGKTGWKVSVIGYGASPPGDPFAVLDEKERIRAVRTAVDLGVNFIDVSPDFAGGKAEVMLGKALRGIPRETFYLATKVGRYGPEAKDFDFSAERVIRSVNESLKRLRVAHIDLIQCQDIEFASLPQVVEETIPALQKLKQQGKVHKIGVTALPLKTLRKVLDRTRLDAALSYCHYCLTDMTLVQMLPYLKSKGTGLINGSPFAMRLLTEKEPPKLHPAPPAVRDICAQAVAYCKKQKTPIARLALQFAVGNKDISTTLVGTATARGVKQNVRWLDDRLDQALLMDVQDILAPIRNQAWPSGHAENN
jgi:L-galactose dehydrogenase